MKFQIMQEQDRNAGITWGTGTEWSILGLVQVRPLLLRNQKVFNIKEQKDLYRSIHENNPLKQRKNFCQKSLRWKNLCIWAYGK